MVKKFGKLIIITGFPASGKDTLVDLLIEKHPNFQKIITHSSRDPRQGEINGIHYHFHLKEEFESLINNNQMFEYTLAGSTYRGTLKDSFENVLMGKTVVWKIDPLRVAKLEETFFEKFDKKKAKILLERCIKIFIKTASSKELLNRYMTRGSEGIDEFKKRLDAEKEVFRKHRKRFPHVVINKKGKQVDALREIEKIIDSLQTNV